MHTQETHLVGFLQKKAKTEAMTVTESLTQRYRQD